LTAGLARGSSIGPHRSLEQVRTISLCRPANLISKDGDGDLRIELFSTDCVKCKRLEFSLHQALSEASIDAELVKVSDIKEMENRGLRSIPALAIDGEIIFAGIVPPVGELRKMLIERARP
jgi:small redox-active disulfide protein 2